MRVTTPEGHYEVEVFKVHPQREWIPPLDDRVFQPPRYRITEPLTVSEFLDKLAPSYLFLDHMAEADTVGTKQEEIRAAIEKGDAAIESWEATMQELKVGNLFTVGWLYAWRWVAAILLGGFVGWSLGMLFSGDKPLLVGVVDVVIGVLLIIVFSVLYYLERKAGTQQ